MVRKVKPQDREPCAWEDTPPTGGVASVIGYDGVAEDTAKGPLWVKLKNQKKNGSLVLNGKKTEE